MALLTVLAAAVVFAWRGGLDRFAVGSPAQFEQRSRLAACGTIDNRQLTAEPAGEAARCLGTAMRNGTGAELVVSGMTTEGDPIISYYRAVPGQSGLEIFHDSTKDRFRSADWSYERCPSARSVNELGECSSRDL